MRRILLCLAFLLLIILPLHAQDGLNLPTELYVLTNEGVVQRFGLGIEGIRQVTPVEQFVLDMAVAPDGNWLAYRTQEALTLTHIFTQQHTQIEAKAESFPPIRGRGDTMVWSPDGKYLAYTMPYGARVYFNTGPIATFADISVSPILHLSWSLNGTYLAAEAENNIWWIYRRDANAMTLVSAIPSSFGTVWLNDSTLIFAPDSGGLIAMDMAQGNAQSVILNDSARYQLPNLLPDGTVLVYERGANGDDTLGTLVSVDLASRDATEIGEGAVSLTNLHWVPTGGFVMAFQGGAIAFNNRSTGLTGFVLPVTSLAAYTWGPLSAEKSAGAELPIDGFFVAPNDSGIAQIWRLPRDGTPPVLVTAAQGDISAYKISSDRRTAAYVSEGGLWSLALSGQSEPIELAQIDTEVQHIHFSPDSRQIAYDTLSTTENPAGGIWLVPTDGSTPAELLIQNGIAGETPSSAPPYYTNPRFAPNVAALLVTEEQTESRNFGLLDIATREFTLLGSANDSIWLSDGRIATYGSGLLVGSPAPFQEVVVLDINTPTQPTRLASIAAPLLIRDIEAINSTSLRVLASATIPGPTQVQAYDIPLAGGDATLVGDVGFMAVVEDAYPLLSPDGEVVAGYTHVGGSLILHNLATGARVILENPLSVRRFQWSPS